MLLLLVLLILGALAWCYVDQNTARPMYKYLDAEGKAHYVDSVDRVPAEFRKQVEAPHDLPRINKMIFETPHPLPEGGPAKQSEKRRK